LATLVTSLPFYRVHEIIEFFTKNVEAIKPERTMVLSTTFITRSRKN